MAVRAAINQPLIFAAVGLKNEKNPVNIVLTSWAYLDGIYSCHQCTLFDPKSKALYN